MQGHQFLAPDMQIYKYMIIQTNEYEYNYSRSAIILRYCLFFLHFSHWKLKTEAPVMQCVQKRDIISSNRATFINLQRLCPYWLVQWSVSLHLTNVGSPPRLQINANKAPPCHVKAQSASPFSLHNMNCNCPK